jgi:amino acid adenylation domain-containing protein
MSQYNPVSCQQEALFGASGNAHNVWLYCGIPVAPQKALARQAFDSLIYRHIMLRTVYSRNGSEVCQRAIEAAACDFQIVDAGCLRQECDRPFDIEHGPVFRARLLLSQNARCSLLLCAHPLASDNQSLQILLRDFAVLYAALAAGHTADLTPLPTGYHDYSRRQRQMISDVRGGASLEFWRSRLAGDAQELDLPLDHSRSVTTVTGHSHLDFELPGDLVERTSSHLVCLAAWAILLSRYGGAENFLVGTLSETRGAQSDNVVGNFADLVAIIARCPSTSTFRQLLQQLAASLTEAHQHADLPFSCLLQELGATCNVTFVWDEPLADMPFEVLETGGNPIPGSFDLALRVAARRDRLQAVLLYRQDLFDATTIERMSRHFVCLLNSIVSSPEAPLGELEMTPDDERALVLGAYSGSDTPYPQHCLHELFAVYAELQPAALALTFGGETLTYRELDLRSNQVAQYLRGHGLRHEEPVAIFMAPSVDVIVSMLGILKAGGACAMLDPTYPAERIEFMLRDMAARWILTHHQAHDNLPAIGIRVYVGGSDSTLSGTSVAPVPNVSTPESVAALIYTSGSTGKPKGALLPHRAIVRAVRNTNYLTITPGDRVSQLASLSFDLCLLEIWSALANGAALIGLPRETLLAPAEMARELRAAGITFFCLPTAQLHEVGRQAPDILKDIPTVLFGGEAAEPGPIRNILRHGPPRNLINAYGPTETGILTSIHKVVAVPEDATDIPIGRPVTNTRMYLLDSRMQPVPLGLRGEIYAGGDGIARGYYNRPELNREKFVADIFSGKPGALLYRTGDLARLRANGDFEFLGRIDDQIKIRGYRIEIPEVQLAVAAHPDVRQAFVMFREDQPGHKRLVAYVTLHRDLPCASDALRRFVNTKLPQYMTPAAFVVMDAVPLTPNGKVDRAALPAPSERSKAANACAVPATDLERGVASIWEELLGVEKIGANDDFFELGGDSLLGMRLMVKLGSSRQERLSLRILFTSSTLRGFCAELQQALTTKH